MMKQSWVYLHLYLGDLRFYKSNIHHILHSTYILMMKRTIDDPRRVGHAGADIELFCIKSVETSRNSGAPMSGCAELPETVTPTNSYSNSPADRRLMKRLASPVRASPQENSHKSGDTRRNNQTITSLSARISR
jgi:hypothetical protein